MAKIIHNQESAAKYLGITLAKLKYLRWHGEGPLVTKVGRTPVYDQADLDAYFESCRSRSVQAFMETGNGLVRKAG